MLTLPIKIQDRNSSFLIQVRHSKLTIDEDLEMTVTVKLVFYTNENGDFGRPLLDVIREDENLTESQKRNDSERFKTVEFISSTRGTMVNPETGESIKPDENGNFPEGSITQLQFWQNVHAEEFPGELLSEKVYAAIIKNMFDIYESNNI